MSTTLTFKTLSFKNFLSYGQNISSVDFNEQGTVAIIGENLDTGGGNGVGKTAIINALCYVLYNAPFDKISLQRLINSTNATKNTSMEVKLSFSKGDDEYEITRIRGEQYFISIIKNDIDITPGKGVHETDAIIQEIIGISYDLFTRTIIFSGNAPAFLQLPLPQQRIQIEELFNITMLSEKALLLKDKIRETESNIKLTEAVIKQQEIASVLYNKHLIEAEQRVKQFENNKILEINNIDNILLQLSTVDFEKEQLLHDEQSSLNKEQVLVISKLKLVKKDYETLLKTTTSLFQEQELLQEAKCPYCSQIYHDAPIKLKKIEQILDKNGEQLSKFEQELPELETKNECLLKKIKEITSNITHTNLSKLTEARLNSTVLNTKVQALRIAINPHIETLEQFKQEYPGEIDKSKIDELRKRLEHEQFLLKLLTDKNSFLRRRIISKSIPFLNNRLNFYSNSLGLPHVVKFDADMSCSVNEYGRELDFGNLSAGEKKRVNTALALSFKDVLHHLHAKVNILLVDELDGSLDQDGIDAVIKVLKNKSRDDETSIFVISHNPAIMGRLDKNLLIRKNAGFSEIIL